MGSPRVYRSRPAAEIENSNTTASRFLGGVRRNWMTGSQNAPVACGLQTRDGRVQKSPRPQNTVPTTTAPDPALTDSVWSGPEVTLMSPVTPGATLPPAAPMQTSQVTVANKPSDPPPAALLSPVPSTDSHPSPIVSHSVPSRPPETGPQPSESPAVVAQPADSETTTLPQLPSRPEDGQDQRWDTTGTAPVPPSDSRRATPVQAPLHVSTNRDPVLSPATRQSPYQSPSGTSTALSQLQINTPTDARRPRQLEAPNPPAQSSSNVIWAQWRANLEQLKAEAKSSESPITLPRVMLLETALDYEDLLYLVLHQVYCRRSVDGRILSEYPALQEECCARGMGRLSILLGDNAKIPEHTLWSFADFPAKLEDLRHEAWFPAKIQEVARLTYNVATHLFPRKDAITPAVYARGYPPLAQEMRMEFQMGSTVLLAVTFSSICRELYTPDKMKKLQTMFRQDILITAQMLGALRQNHLEQQSTSEQQIDELVEAYKKIPMRPRSSPASAQFLLAGPPGSQTQAPPTHVFGLPSAGSQPSVASPVGSAFAYTPTTVNSPQAMMVQSPGYFQGPFARSSQQQQQQQQIQMQRIQRQQQQHQQMQMQMQMQQIRQQAVQMGLFYPAVPPQEQSTLSYPFQHVPQRSSQSAYAGHQSARRGQAQMAIQAQRHQSISSPAQSVALSQVPPPHLPAQVAQQQGPQLSDSSQVNMTVQPRVSQGPPLQIPHGQVGPQTTVPPRQVPPLPPTQGPNVPYPSPLGSLLPPADYWPPQTVAPNPMRLGIHQADLRDPVKKLLKKGSSGEWVETELYHFHGDFVLTPQFVDPNVLSYNWTFTLFEEDCQRLPHLQKLGRGQRPVRSFQPGCRTFRLRSVALCDSEAKDSQLLWHTKGITWPSVFYIHVNDCELFVRRKVHNGKDLPLDITHHLKMGENRVSVNFLLGEKECQNFKYYFGVERMLTTLFEHVRNTVGTMSADETRRIIRNRLTPSSNNDDDVAFITDNLTINLVDPFMAQIFKIPARSMHCTHLECFDLETFIQTRKSQSGPTPFNDQWRCPICDTDARPQCLRVDPFFIEIRDELIRTHRLEAAQAIQVKADGSWTLKDTENKPSVSPHPSRATSVSSKRKADGSPDIGPEASRAKTEGSPIRNLDGHVREREVIEID